MGLSWFPVAWADLNDGLVAYYPFNGNANDESGNGHDGIVNGATLTQDRFNEPNSAYSFENSYIQIDEVSDFDLFDFTYSVWIKANSMSGWNSIVDIDNDKQLLGLKNAQYAIWGRCGTFRHSTVTNGWHHVVWTVFGQHYTLYVDGDVVGMGDTCSLQNVDGSHLMIGSGLGGNEYFDGKIDDVHIYNRALSECEIQSLYTGEDECYVSTLTIEAPTGGGKLIIMAKPSKGWKFKEWAGDCKGNNKKPAKTVVKMNKDQHCAAVFEPKP
jgi:hypothetical protein